MNGLLHRFAICFFVFFAVCVLCACSRDEPPKELLQSYLDVELRLGDDIAIASVEPQWLKNGEFAYEGKAAVSFVLKQPLYTRAGLEESLEAAGEKSAETAMLRHAVELANGLPEPLRSSLLERAPKSPPGDWTFIRESTPAKQKSTVEFRLRADKTERGWTFTMLMSPGRPEAFKGSPRTAFAEKAHIVGSDETRDAIQKYIEKVKAFAGDVDEASANLAKAKRDAVAAKREAVLAALQPGAIFWGALEKKDSPSRFFGVVLGSPNAAGLSFPVEILVPDDFPELPPGVLHLRNDAGSPYPLSLSSSFVNADLDLDDGKLAGPALTAGGCVFLMPITAEQLGKEKDAAAGRIAEQKARAEQAAMEKKEREDAYAKALQNALAPGTGFQGKWENRGRGGSIGFAFTRVDEKNLSAQGFIFDPLERSKRKPFTAVVNRAFGANNALVIQTTPGKGLSYKETATDFQRDWLRSESKDTLTLKLTPEGGWQGSTQEKTSIAVSPVAGFAEELAAEARAIEEHRKAVKEAVASGSTWLGTFQCGSDSGEVGLYFEKSVENTVAGYVFDPLMPEAVKPFTGSYTLDGKERFAVKMKTVYAPGLKTDSDTPRMRRLWLRQRSDYEVLFSPDGLASTSDCSARFNRSASEYPALLEAYNKQVQAGYEAFVASVQPGRHYGGTWHVERNSGELGLVFTSIRSVSVTADVYDPAEPKTRWKYTGSLTSQGVGKYAVTLQPASKEYKGREFPEGSTQYLLNRSTSSYHTLLLDKTSEGFEGLWNAAGERLAVSLPDASPQTSVPKKEAAPEEGAARAQSGSADGEKAGKSAEQASGGEDSTPTPPAPAKAALPPVVAETTPETAQSPGVEEAAPEAAHPETPYPALTPGAGGKPTIAVHRVSAEGGKVVFAVQVLAPDKVMTAMRIDNVGGVSSNWRSDGKGAAPLTVSEKSETLATGKEDMSVPMGGGERLFHVSFTDNGAVSGGGTDLRVTVFFANKERAMALSAK